MKPSDPSLGCAGDAGYIDAVTTAVLLEERSEMSATGRLDIAIVEDLKVCHDGFFRPKVGPARSLRICFE